MTGQSAKATIVRWGVVAFLCTAAGIAYLDRVVISVVIQELEETLGMTDMEAGWIMAAFVIGYGLMQVPTGRLGDRVGIRYALPAIVVVWSLMTGLTAVAGTFGVLFMIRCCFGMAQAGVFPFTVPALRRWFPLESRGTAQGVVVTGTRVGAILAGLASPLIAKFGWQRVFIACGVLGGVWAALFAWWFRDRPERHAGANEAELRLIRGGRDAPPGVGGRTTPDEPQQAALPLWRLCLNANLWGMSLAQFFGAMGYYLYITWFPSYLRNRYGLSLELAGMLSIAPHLGGLLGTAIGGPLTDALLRMTGSLRWSRRAIWLVGKAGCGLLFLIAAGRENPYAAVALVGVAALLADSGGPASWAMVTDVGRQHSGTVFGVQNTAGCVGAVLCPLLVPTVVQWQGWNAVLPVFSVIFFACAASWLWVDASRPISRQRPPDASER